MSISKKSIITQKSITIIIRKASLLKMMIKMHSFVIVKMVDHCKLSFIVWCFHESGPLFYHALMILNSLLHTMIWNLSFEKRSINLRTLDTIWSNRIQHFCTNLHNHYKLCWSLYHIKKKLLSNRKISINWFSS